MADGTLDPFQAFLLLDDARQWRNRAEEMRVTAEAMRDETCRRIAQNIARDYDRMAQHAERRAKMRRLHSSKRTKLSATRPKMTAHVIAVCPLCHGLQWVCEAHPDHPWDGKCCDGAGDPCPRCNALTQGARPALPGGYEAGRIMKKSAFEVILDCLHMTGSKSSAIADAKVAQGILDTLVHVGFIVATRQELAAARKPLINNGPRETLRYSIDVYESENLVEVLGRVAELDIAHAAFEAAVRNHPGKIILLRQGASVHRRSDRMER
jgi:hypothetical protein